MVAGLRACLAGCASLRRLSRTRTGAARLRPSLEPRIKRRSREARTTRDMRYDLHRRLSVLRVVFLPFAGWRGQTVATAVAHRRRPRGNPASRSFPRSQPVRRVGGRRQGCPKGIAKRLALDTGRRPGEWPGVEGMAGGRLRSKLRLIRAALRAGAVPVWLPPAANDHATERARCSLGDPVNAPRRSYERETTTMSAGSGWSRVPRSVRAGGASGPPVSAEVCVGGCQR